MKLVDEIVSLRREIAALRVQVDRLSGIRSDAEPLAVEIGFGNLPRFWSDRPIRSRVIDAHRQMPVGELRANLIEQFGEGRAPSRSAIYRFWQRLDQIAARARDNVSQASKGRK